MKEHVKQKRMETLKEFQTRLFGGADADLPFGPIIFVSNETMLKVPAPSVKRHLTVGYFSCFSLSLLSIHGMRLRPLQSFLVCILPFMCIFH